MSLSLKIEGLLSEAKVKSAGPSVGAMTAEQLIDLIDKRAPDGEFSLQDIFTPDEVEALSRNPNLDAIEDISDVIYSALQELIKGESSDDEDDEDDDDDDSIDYEAETLDAPANEALDPEIVHARYFERYKRATDVSSKIRNNPDFDIKGLISRRIKPLPDNVPFSLSDIFSLKELEAIIKHPKHNSLDPDIRGNILDALDAHVESIGDDIDDALIEAVLGAQGVLESGDVAVAALMAGFAYLDGKTYRVNTLGERHAFYLTRQRLIGSEGFILEDSIPGEQLEDSNSDEMSDLIAKVSKSRKRVSIRPNLNSKGEVTIHTGSLGRKLGSVRAVTIECDSVVVRPSGQAIAQKEGEKTVHAGFIGRLHPEVIMPKSDDPSVTYNPHKGDKEFKLNGKPYEGGGLITMVGWKAFKVD